MASWHFSRIVGTISGDAADLLIRRDLAEQVGQDRRITDVVPCDFDGSNLQRFFIDPYVYLAPDAPFGTAHCPLGYCEAMHDRDACGRSTRLHPRP
jgi:hypothetical protein